MLVLAKSKNSLAILSLVVDRSSRILYKVVLYKHKACFVIEHALFASVRDLFPSII